jgi:hypothetical protein
VVTVAVAATASCVGATSVTTGALVGSARQPVIASKRMMQVVSKMKPGFLSECLMQVFYLTFLNSHHSVPTLYRLLPKFLLKRILEKEG